MDAGKKILIVEDNERNRRLLKDVLEYYGYDVIEAENGEMAIEKARERKPDLIIMDIQMPVMDGMAAAGATRGDAETKGIPIIAITSFAMKGDRERFMEAGFDDYIAKPIDTRKLPGVIKKHLG